MDKDNNPFNGVYYSTIIVLIILFITFRELSYDFSIKWQLTASAPIERITTKIVETGPFSFELKNNFYFISEVFKATPIQHNDQALTLFLIIWWMGITALLAFATHARKFLFFIILLLVLFMVNLLELDSLSILGSGPGSKWATIIQIITLAIPAYYFHAIRPEKSWILKWAIIFILSIIPLVIGYVQSPFFTTHVLANSFYASAILAILFIFIIAEENIYGILYLVTRSRGSRHNEKHFTAISVIYIGYITLYFLNKARLISIQLPYFEAFYLLLISTVVATFTIRFKQSMVDRYLRQAVDIRLLFLGLMLSGISYFLIGFSRGNDASYEAMHYLIVYFHMGFGFMFFTYIIANFVNPLIEGLQIYKIAYNERNFPYVTARLGGLAIVIACFFMSEKAALNLLHGARYNYQGDIYLSQREARLASGYFTEGLTYAANNHYSGYQLAQYFEIIQKPTDALYRYHRATVRHPSSQAFVNQAILQREWNDLSVATRTLREGALSKPTPQLKNNLAVYLFDNGVAKEPLEIIGSIENTGDWNQAAHVNSWRFGMQEDVENDYKKGNIAVKTNILGQIAQSSVEKPTLEPVRNLSENPSLHEITYLINANLYYDQESFEELNQKVKEVAINAELQRDLKEAEITNFYQNGLISKSFYALQNLLFQAKTWEKGEYYRWLGLYALDQQAWLLAESFLEQSLEFGHDNSLMPLLAAQLESQNWFGAKNTLTKLLIENPNNQSLAEALTPVIEGNEIQSSAYLHYRWKDYSPVEMASLFNELEAPEKLQLWDKITSQLTDREKWELLEQYRNALMPFLTPELDQLYLEKTRLREQPDFENPFAHWRMIHVDISSENELDIFYNQLVEALEINPFSVSLNKTFSRYAIQLGLFEYAETALVRLFSLMEPEEYQQFEREFFDLTYAKKQASREWIN